CLFMQFIREMDDLLFSGWICLSIKIYRIIIWHVCLHKHFFIAISLTMSNRIGYQALSHLKMGNTHRLLIMLLMLQQVGFYFLILNKESRTPQPSFGLFDDEGYLEAINLK